MTPNLYGNLVANTAAGIAGGTGVMPGGKVTCSSHYTLELQYWIKNASEIYITVT